MDAYFVRVYTMKDGRKVIPNCSYALYEQAEGDLGSFRLDLAASKDEEPAFDLSEVSYVQIEKRYTPTPIWYNGESEAAAATTAPLADYGDSDHGAWNGEGPMVKNPKLSD